MHLNQRNYEISIEVNNLRNLFSGDVTTAVWEILLRVLGNARDLKLNKQSLKGNKQCIYF